MKIQTSTIGRPNKQEGMTLLETVVVLILMVILAGVAAPRAWEALRSSALDQEIKTCSRFVEQGIDAAKRTQEHVTLSLSLDSGELSLASSSQIFARSALQNNLLFQIYTSKKTYSSGLVTLDIKPAGIIDETSIIFSDDHEKRTMHIQPFRGKIQIYSGAQPHRGSNE